MRGRHGGLPVRAFLHLAVGKFDEDAGGRMPEPQAERHADALTESMAERAAGHLDAGRGVERRHVEPAVVGPVGCELVQRDHAGFGERRPERDRIMAGREQEAVALRPGKIGRVPAQFMEIEGSERVGDAEPLADIALPGSARHGEHVATHVRGMGAQRGEIGSSGGVVALRHDQSLSSPPLALSRSAMM